MHNFKKTAAMRFQRNNVAVFTQRVEVYIPKSFLACLARLGFRQESGKREGFCWRRDVKFRSSATQKVYIDFEERTIRLKFIDGKGVEFDGMRFPNFSAFCRNVDIRSMKK